MINRRNYSLLKSLVQDIQRQYLLFIVVMFLCISCTSVSTTILPKSTRVLGATSIYISADGNKVELVQDDNTGIAIVKLMDGGIAILPAEIIGMEGRYKNDRMTLWEHDGGLQLWVGGKIVFSGVVVKKEE